MRINPGDDVLVNTKQVVVFNGAKHKFNNSGVIEGDLGIFFCICMHTYTGELMALCTNTNRVTDCAWYYLDEIEFLGEWE